MHLNLLGLLKHLASTSNTLLHIVFGEKVHPNHVISNVLFLVSGSASEQNKEGACEERDVLNMNLGP